MKELSFEYLLNKIIESISMISIIDGIESFQLSDSFLLKLDNGDVIQILNDNNKVRFLKIESKSEIVLLSDYEIEGQPNIVMDEIVVNLKRIKIFQNYTSKGSNYFFGTKILDEEENFILGFFYGFDEIEYTLDIVDFENALLHYKEDYVVNVIR